MCAGASVQMHTILTCLGVEKQAVVLHFALKELFCASQRALDVTKKPCMRLDETAIMRNDLVSSSRHRAGDVLLQPSSGNSSTHNYNAKAQSANSDHNSRIKVCVARDQDFHDQIGSQQWFDLMDPEKVLEQGLPLLFAFCLFCLL